MALAPDLVATATAYDPQWGAKNLGDIRLSMNPSELDRYLGLGKQGAELKIYPRVPPLTQKTDLSAAERLDKDTWSFDPSTVKIKQIDCHGGL